MKTKSLFIAISLSILALSVVSCNHDDNLSNEPLSILQSSSEGISTFATQNICPVLGATNPLTANEIEFLYAMREDEKLAKDLTAAFKARYTTSLLFANISVAEATHITAIETLLNYYEITFATLGAQGVFADITRQQQYDELLTQGNTLIGAYQATALLEEENIAVYSEVLLTIDNANIKLLVENMIRASTNHFRAYIRQIIALGGTYTPTYLDVTTYNNIINSSPEQGNRYGQQQNGKHNGQNTNSRKCNQSQGQKGSVNASGNCTGTCNGSLSGTNTGKGNVGKGYRR